MKNDGGGVTYKEINSFIQAENWVFKQSNSGGGGIDNYNNNNNNTAKF